MNNEEIKKQVFEQLKQCCQSGIKKFNESKLLQDVYEGLTDEANNLHEAGDNKRYEEMLCGAKAFRSAAFLMFIAHPEYDELQVFEALAPSKEVRDMVRAFRRNS